MLKALFFDQDGVIADTEKNGHRVAFNKTFRELGMDIYWSAEEYGTMLDIGGGKERIARYLESNEKGEPFTVNHPLVKKIYEVKTRKFLEIIEKGKLLPRIGIRRLMKEANVRGVKVGICTTSHIRNAEKISKILLKGIIIDFILAGDMVAKKKPDPEIYFKALDKAGCKPIECAVIEDSGIGLQAAANAGLKVIATITDYTKDDDLSRAEMVLTCLGDTETRYDVIRSTHKMKGISGIISIDDIRGMIEGRE